MLSSAVGNRVLKSNRGKIIRFAKLSDLITSIIHVAKVSMLIPYYMCHFTYCIITAICRDYNRFHAGP